MARQTGAGAALECSTTTGVPPALLLHLDPEQYRNLADHPGDSDDNSDDVAALGVWSPPVEVGWDATTVRRIAENAEGPRSLKLA